SAVPSPRATHGLSLPSNPYDRMLGYPTIFFDRMFRVNHHPHRRILSALRLFLFLLLLALAVAPPRVASAQQARFPSRKGGVANLEARTQGAKATSPPLTATWTFNTRKPVFAPTTSN